MSLHHLSHIPTSDAFCSQGDPSFLDRCERIAYNALPGTINPDMWRHQYLQQSNEINALYGIRDHVWQVGRMLTWGRGGKGGAVMAGMGSRCAHCIEPHPS